MNYFLILMMIILSTAHAALPQDSTLPLLPTITKNDIQCKKIVITDYKQAALKIASGDNVQQVCPAGFVPGGVSISHFPAGSAGATQSKKHWFYDNDNPTASDPTYVAYHSGNTTYHYIPGAPNAGIPPLNTNSDDPIWYRNKANEVKLYCYRRRVVFTPGPCTN